MDAIRLAEHWKKELRLTDWVTDISVKSSLGDNLGTNSTIVERRVANIEVEKDDPDLEATIVHEQLHCYFPLEGLDEKSYEYVRAEQGIDAISELLVRQRKEILELRKQCEALSNGSKTTTRRTSAKRR